MADIGFWQIWRLANCFTTIGVIQKRVLQKQAFSTFTILYPRNNNFTANKYALGKKPNGLQVSYSNLLDFFAFYSGDTFL